MKFHVMSYSLSSSSLLSVLVRCNPYKGQSCILSREPPLTKLCIPVTISLLASSSCMKRTQCVTAEVFNPLAP